MSVEEHTRIQEVEVQALDAARLEPLIGRDRTARDRHLEQYCQLLAQLG